MLSNKNNGSFTHIQIHVQVTAGKIHIGHVGYDGFSPLAYGGRMVGNTGRGHDAGHGGHGGSLRQAAALNASGGALQVAQGLLAGGGSRHQGAVRCLQGHQGVCLEAVFSFFFSLVDAIHLLEIVNII